MWPNTPGVQTSRLQMPQIPTFGNDENQQLKVSQQTQAAQAQITRYHAENAQREQRLLEAQQAIAELRRDGAEIEKRRNEQIESDTRFEALNKSQYEAAYQSLRAMLEHQQPADLRQAVFLVENTYMANQSNYAGFNKAIEDLAGVCRDLAGVNSTATSRFMALHRLMSDTIAIGYADQHTGQHLPYAYDFVDFEGKQNYSQQFVHKLLATNSGQCHSLPLLYKLIADALDVKTYLSVAPNHMYIQIKDDRGELFSYETTNHHFVTDAYYMSTGFIKMAALKHRTYLDTLSRQETLASSVFDLALGYENRFGRDAFMHKCALLGLRYYPHSALGRMIVYNTTLAKFTSAWAAAGKPTRKQIEQNHSSLEALWQDVERYQRAINESGHEEMPPEQYARWLQDMNQEQTRVSMQQAARFEQSIPK